MFRAFLLLFLLAPSGLMAQEPAPLPRLLQSAYAQVGKTVSYDPAYTSIAFPGGDVPLDRGVCTDVIVRAYRGIGVDLQFLVNKDMHAAFSAYPKLWGLSAARRQHRSPARSEPCGVFQASRQGAAGFQPTRAIISPETS